MFDNCSVAHCPSTPAQDFGWACFGASVNTLCRGLLLVGLLGLGHMASGVQLDNAPTINDWSRLQRAELDKAIQKKMDQINPPPVVVPVAPIVPVSRPVVVVKPKPVVTKTILGVYGRPGSEVVEIGMPDGSIVKAVAGQQVQDFMVTTVQAGRVVIERPMKVSTSTGKRSASAKPRRADAVATPVTPRMHTMYLVTGARFD